MTVKHLGASYDFPSANRAENYGGDWNIYIYWYDHQIYACPAAYRLPPSMPFRKFLDEMFKADYARHPETSKIEWDKAEWEYEGKPWKPKLDGSLADNGLEHMSYLKFRTPGLKGMHGVGN